MGFLEEQIYAGFWYRFIAVLIDIVVVSIIVFPFAIAIGLMSSNLVVVEVPFGLFTTSETLSETKKVVENSDGSSSMVITQQIKETVLGQWENYYEISTSKNDGNDKSTKSLIDPSTNLPKEITTSGDIEFFVIFVYWIFMEASIYQGSVGKLAMGIRVVNMEGGRPTVFQAISRNLLKLLSGMILFIGFMMAGWTARKQALHDKITNFVVIKNP